MTPTEFKVRYPEFNTETDQRVQLFLDEAIPHLDQARWDDLYVQGLGLYVAHSLALANADVGADIGNETNVKVGDVSLSKDSSIVKAQMDNEFYRTTYGQRYWRMAQMVGAGGIAS